MLLRPRSLSPEALHKRLKWRLVAVSVLLLIVVGLVTWNVANDAQSRVIQYQAVKLAEVVARQAASARSVYTTQVVEKLRRDGFGAAEGYAHMTGYVALPAQFLKMLGQSATTESDGLYRYRPLSKWNLDEDQGLSDDFQRWAWKFIEAQDQAQPTGPIDWEPLWRIENIDGVRTLRYMRADPATSAACVSCHNKHEQRPEIVARRVNSNVETGKQWAQHQLLGAIEVNIPLDKVETLAFVENKQTLSVIVGVVVSGLLIIGFFVFTDVTRAHTMAQQLSWHARHDVLTGMANRGEFEFLLEQALIKTRAHDETHALLFIDLDQFKIINDTSGHTVGDELLRQIGATLKSKIRKIDTLARLGGDEFGVLLEGCTLQTAVKIAEDLCKAVRDFRFVWNHRTFEIGASIGLVMVNRDSESVAALMSAADVACYAAKDAGRNRVHVFTDSDTEIDKRRTELEWASRITRALKEGWFSLAVQKGQALRPDLPYRSYSEILLRMVDENGKAVPILTVIRSAERYDLMPAVDRWVLRKVCTLLTSGHLQTEDRELIAINISGMSVNDDNFLAFARAELKACGALAKRICFELTETAAIRNFAKATEFMRALKTFGCCFALDDFGSGLSSFGYLKNLSVDFIKIDGNFISTMIDDKIGRAMVEAIAQIGRVMGIPIIAEGVENESLLNLVKEVGIEYAQGFTLHYPEPIQQAFRRRKA